MNFTPFAGEIIIYDTDENYSYPRIKIGDGETNINNLPFITPVRGVDFWTEADKNEIKSYVDSAILGGEW